ncbi:MAG: zinc-binding alcohol dehydrogenase [Chloroflexota bacterium]|nr:zinc-binding alcohol dehydrogenase [Chloroflexota bacterium]
MPRELIAIAPRTPVLREYEEPDLGSHQIRIRAEFASPKHGTELVAYRNDPAANRPYDRGLGCVMPRTEEQAARAFPHPLGNMAVGVVTDVGVEVSRFKRGDQVFGHLPIRETYTVDESMVDLLPDGLTAEAAMCLDPTVMAMAMRDAPVRLGDWVAIFGMGAIGLMAVQLARISGADLVIGIDLIETRRNLARDLGADVALDPNADGGDVGLTIRRMTGRSGQQDSEQPARKRVLGGYWEVPQDWSRCGVDVAVEASGSIRALQQAIRATRYGGTICVLSFYGGDAAGLRLGEEFHINRLQLVSARSESLPMRDHPGWTLQRYVELSLRWLVSGRLRTEGIVTPIVSFEDSVDAYRNIDEHPEESIKLGIRFT